MTFDYDAVGNRTEMVDSTGTTTYGYDALNRLETVTFPGSRSVEYGYDAVGRRTSITYPGGTDEVAYEYDEAGNLVSVTDWNDAETAYDYDDAGMLTTVTLPSGTGVTGTYAYDNADRLTSVTWAKSGAGTLASASYTLDSVGNRTQRVDQAGTHVYTYDALYRLTGADYPGADNHTYTYDAVGNRLTKTGVTGGYVYDAADRMTSAGGVSYGWDDNGNLTSRGSDAFSWDVEDRLTSATVSSVTTTFAYNGDGLRDSLTTGGNTTTFTWDVNRSIPQVLDDEDRRYVYGVGRIAQVGASATHYYLPDGLGSTMALVDEAGAVVNDYDYDVFGALRDSSGSQDNDFTFAGEQVDGTGLQYLRARYYDLATGRFISKDPLSLSPKSQVHVYAYAENQPLDLSDPTGLDPEDDEPEPVPLPAPGSLKEKLGRCEDGWNDCMNRVRWNLIEESHGTLEPWEAARVCLDYYNICVEEVNREGGRGDFKSREAEKRMRAIFETRESLLNWIIKQLPSTGSGGYVDPSLDSKEGTLVIVACGL